MISSTSGVSEIINRKYISDFRGVRIRILTIETESNLYISKIRFLFPVSFTIEYKVGIAEFYLHMGFAADLSKNLVTRA